MDIKKCLYNLKMTDSIFFSNFEDFGLFMSNYVSKKYVQKVKIKPAFII